MFEKLVWKPETEIHDFTPPEHAEDMHPNLRWASLHSPRSYGYLIRARFWLHQLTPLNYHIQLEEQGMQRLIHYDKL